MERLTGRRDERTYIIGCPDFALPKIAGLIIQQTVDRLAAIEDILGDEYDLEHLSPCTFCRFNPPSSCDGKPCCMCPAEKK